MPKVEKPIQVLFPEERVELPDGSFVVVRPLSLKDFPKLIRAFGNVATEVATKGSATQNELGMEMLAEISNEILPYCIDRKPEEIPFDKAPDIIELILEQNFTGESVKKWSALAQKIPGLADVVSKKSESESEATLSQSKTSKK